MVLHGKSKGRHRAGTVMVVLTAVFVLGIAILYVTGWFHDSVPVREYAGYIVENIPGVDEMSDRENINNIRDYFYFFQGLSLRYEVSLYMEQGAVELVLYEIPIEQPFLYAGQELQCTESKLFRETTEGEWIPEKLEPGKRYALAIYAEDGSAVSGSVQALYSVYRWQELYEAWVCRLPFFKSKYNPRYQPFWSEW